MRPNTKWKLFLNIFIVLLIFCVMIFLVKNSLGKILLELTKTAPLILIAVIFLGIAYQFFEGWSIQAIAQVFSKEFRIVDGMLSAIYVAFYRVITFGAGTLVSEVNFYNQKGLKVSQSLGVTSLHMMMYKAAILTYAILALIVQFPKIYIHEPNILIPILIGMIITAAIILVILAISISVNLQVVFLVVCDKWLKSQKLREFIDRCNLQIYSLRETMYSVLHNRTAVVKIYGLNLIKIAMWYMIPYVCLITIHPDLDFLLVFSLISFTVVLAGVIPTPAGIGSFEFVYLFLFSQLVGTVDAVSSMLLYRFASYVLPFLLGFVQMLVNRKKVISNEIAELKTERNQS